MATRIIPAAFIALMLAARAIGQETPTALPKDDPPELAAPAQAAPPAEPAPSVIQEDLSGYKTGPAGRFWSEFDVLGWWVKGSHLPPLLTTSPDGTARAQAGVLGAPGTTTVFGGSNANNGLRLGGQVTLGFWLNPEMCSGIQLGFFGLQGLGNTFYTSSPGGPILARPFNDATTNQAASELVAFPGVVAGSVTANATTSSFFGANALFRQKICCGGCYRIDALAGYQYLHFADGVALTENLINTNPGGAVPVGTNLVVSDSFRANNDFNGFRTGLVGRTWRGHWMLEGLATVAVGRTTESLQINGSTTITAPGSAPIVNSGGLYALSSNAGTYHNQPWSLVPQFGSRIGYQINRNVYVFAGYTLLWWNSVLRAGNQIDTTVNPNLIPPITSAPNAALRPAPFLHESSIWAQGVTLGVGFRF